MLTFEMSYTWLKFLVEIGSKFSSGIWKRHCIIMNTQYILLSKYISERIVARTYQAWARRSCNFGIMIDTAVGRFSPEVLMRLHKRLGLPLKRDIVRKCSLRRCISVGTSSPSVVMTPFKNDGFLTFFLLSSLWEDTPLICDLAKSKVMRIDSERESWSLPRLRKLIGSGARCREDEYGWTRGWK